MEPEQDELRGLEPARVCPGPPPGLFQAQQLLQLHPPAQHLCLFSLSVRFLIICFDSASDSNWVQLLIVEFI